MGALLTPGFGSSNTFNYDVNARVQENVANLLNKIAQNGDIASFQLQSGIIGLSDFNSSLSGWKSGAALFYGLKKVLYVEIILAHIGNICG